jgi:hypothetical protein
MKMVATATEQETLHQNMVTPPGVAQQSPEVGSDLPPTPEDDSEDSRNGFFENAVRNIFGPCVGVVDVASFFIQNTCRGQTKEEDRGAEGPAILKMKLRKPAPGQRSRRRQGETLEFPSHGGFDDDVSAISARTLEEMERLEFMPKDIKPLASSRTRAIPSGDTSEPKDTRESRALNKSIPGRKRGSPASQPDLDWTYQIQRPTSATEMSLGVSTSGSNSSAEPEQTSPSRDGHRSDGTKLFTRVEV